MEQATLATSYSFSAPFVTTKGGQVFSDLRVYQPFCARPCVSLKTSASDNSRRHFLQLNRHFPLKANKSFCIKASKHLHSDHLNVEETSTQTQNCEVLLQKTDDNMVLANLRNPCDNETSTSKPIKFKNRFLNFVRFGSVLNNAAESFFKSEIRRRLFVTAVLLVISRIGYFIPLPGFDRRLIPEDYLSFASGSVDELGDFAAELKLSLFQLGISPQIAASLLMQVLTYVIPSLVKLRKEGLDGHERIKGYIWWLTLGFAMLESLILACYSLPYSIYAASHRVKHVMLTSSLLVCGAMTITWICDKITEAGFGQGSSLIICVGILTGYTETLYNMLTQLSVSAVYLWPYVLAVLGIFTVVTMSAVVVTEGCRKIKLQYYGFKLASDTREGSKITEVEPYIPFNINPAGMQPVLTTTYLLAFPSILASLLGSRFWEHVKQILNPETSLGADPWVYYLVYAFFVFIFNILDIANMPKEIAEYLNKMGARIPSTKPGKATIEYLTKVQASTRFWGGLLLSFLATSSSILDHNLRRMNQGFSIGFTSILIIILDVPWSLCALLMLLLGSFLVFLVGSIIELRRSYQAYNVMPSLSKALRRYGV